MNNYRKTAIIVGVLYIIGTVSGILSMASSGPVRAATYLSSIAANPNQIVIAALFVLLMGLTLALVPVMLFPLLKKFNEVSTNSETLKENAYSMMEAVTRFNLREKNELT